MTAGSTECDAKETEAYTTKGVFDGPNIVRPSFDFDWTIGQWMAC